MAPCRLPELGSARSGRQNGEISRVRVVGQNGAQKFPGWRQQRPFDIGVLPKRNCKAAMPSFKAETQSFRTPSKDVEGHR